MQASHVDVRVVSRMFDPQVGEEFGSAVTEDLDIAFLLILEWLDRIRAERIYLSASALRIRDEHNHLDPAALEALLFVKCFGAERIAPVRDSARAQPRDPE